MEAGLSTKQCFVIMPFDNDKYDRRYDETFSSAIQSAGFKPYRVDKDPSVQIPIEQIHEKIKLSDACFAEISTDNPNVWYELGCAIALSKPVVMVCDENRKDQFPFDVRHRSIIRYRTDSLSGFIALERQISDKLRSLPAPVPPLLPHSTNKSRPATPELAQHELATLETIATAEVCPRSFLVNRLGEIGFTGIAVAMALRALQENSFIHKREQNVEGTVCAEYSLTEEGWKAIQSNVSKLVLRELQDDIPF
jgi:hypothetical protein